jgi:transposase-like protein
MPRIDEDTQHCVIYLYRSAEDAWAGKCAAGSGFLMALDSATEPERRLLYAITNSRVIKSGYPVIRSDSMTGNIHLFEKDKKDWVHHPDGEDVAACLLGLATEYPHLKHYHLKRFLTGELMDQLRIGVGSDLFLMGRQITSRDVQCHSPFSRPGKLAMFDHPSGKRAGKVSRECFHVTVFVPGEHSGAPVFVEPDNVLGRESPELSGGITVPWLLGIDQGLHQRYEPVIDAQGKYHPRRWKVRSPYGVVAVVPAWRLRELLETEEFKEARRKLALRAGWKDEEHRADAQDGAQIFTRADYLEALKLASRKIGKGAPISGDTSTGDLRRRQSGNGMAYSIEDFREDFSDENACLKWLKEYLYPGGLHCHKCQSVTLHAKMVARRSYSCARCGHHLHPTVGTIYHNSRKPLHLWFEAIYYMTSNAGHITATQLEQELKVNYKTSWRMCKEIRQMLRREMMKT